MDRATVLRSSSRSLERVAQPDADPGAPPGIRPSARQPVRAYLGATLPARIGHRGDASMGCFASDGAYLGVITTPAGLEVTTILDNAVAGVFRDSMDVEYVRVYRLSAGPPGPGR